MLRLFVVCSFSLVLSITVLAFWLAMIYVEPVLSGHAGLAA